MVVQHLHRPYPEDMFDFANITDAQILDTCKCLKEFNSPGPDGIPNEVYSHCADILIPFLGRLYRATFDLEYYPDAWKESITVVLCKPGHTDYSLAKSYRPIALMNCMGKILSSCITDVLEFNSEQLGLLPNHHFSSHAGHTMTDSLHLITKTVHNAWCNGKVASILFLDVKAAFPSAIPECLFHRMCKLGIPTAIVNWLHCKLKGRCMYLKFDDFISDLFEILNGINQGCPLSVILYKIYNTLLLNPSKALKNLDAVAYIDDVVAAAVGKTLTDTSVAFIDYMTRPLGALTWSKSSNSLFNVPKLALMHLNLKLPADDLGPEITLPAGTVQPTASMKFLGIILDNKLRFKQQAEYALVKGTKWIQQFGRLVRPKHGLKARHVLTPSGKTFFT